MLHDGLIKSGFRIQDLCQVMDQQPQIRQGDGDGSRGNEWVEVMGVSFFWAGPLSSTTALVWWQFIICLRAFSGLSRQLPRNGPWAYLGWSSSSSNTLAAFRLDWLRTLAPRMAWAQVCLLGQRVGCPLRHLPPNPGPLAASLCDLLWLRPRNRRGCFLWRGTFTPSQGCVCALENKMDHVSETTTNLK